MQFIDKVKIIAGLIWTEMNKQPCPLGEHDRLKKSILSYNFRLTECHGCVLNFKLQIQCLFVPIKVIKIELTWKFLVCFGDFTVGFLDKTLHKRTPCDPFIIFPVMCFNEVMT